MKSQTLFSVTVMAILGAVRLCGQPQPGTVLWTFDTPDFIRSSPAVGLDGTIYLGASGNLYAITNSGSNKWVFATSGTQDDSPAVGSDGAIYYTSLSAGDSLHAINSNGSSRWSYQAQAANSSVAIGWDNTIYVAGVSYLHAVSFYGTNLWKAPIPDVDPFGYFGSPALGRDGVIYYPSPNLGLLAISTNGKQQWAFQASSSPGDSVAVGADGTIYVAAGPLYALAPSGTNLWTSDTNDFTGSSPAIGKDGTVYVPTSGGSLCAFNPAGQFEWQVLTNGPTHGGKTPAVDSAGTIYYLAYSTLFAISPAGKVQWAMSLIHDPVDSFGTSLTSPTIGPDGTIYVTSARRLYAISGNNALADSSWPMYRQNCRHTGKMEKPALKPPQKRADANFDLQLYGQLGGTFTIEGSTNLNSWTSLTSFVATTVPMDVVDTKASNSLSKFYRAFGPP
jgi:hypothetical protein